MTLQEQCSFCNELVVERCLSCGKGSCGKPEHEYAAFFIRRGGTPSDNIGAKFFFYCSHCQGVTCSGCIIKQTENQPSAEVLEFREFECRNCTLPLITVRIDNQNLWQATEQMHDYLRFEGRAIEEGKLVSEFNGWHKSLVIYPGDIGWISFAAEKPVSAGEALVIGFEVQGKTYELFHYTVPNPYTLMRREGEIQYLDRKKVLYEEGFTITHDHAGIYIANKSGSNISWLKKGTYESRGRENLAERTNPQVKEDSPKKAMLRRKLAELTAKQIWDFMMMQSDKEHEKGEVHLAGSTNLTYYHLVEIFFKKVTFCTMGKYFHHPAFELASDVLEEQVRDLRRNYDEEQYIFVIREDSGSAGERRSFVMAEYMFVEYM